MKISTRSRYGLRAMLELALHHGEGPVMMQSIAENQGVSRKYLDTIFASLKNAGLIHSRRGIGGGHVLARSPEQIRVGEILRAIEGPISLVDCVRDPDFCSRTHRCVTRDVWAAVTEAIEAVLDSMTLADLLEKHRLRWSEIRPTGEAGEPTAPDERCLLDLRAAPRARALGRRLRRARARGRLGGVSFDPYQILGVERRATTDEIRRVYRALARRYHPDVNSGEQAEERFKLLAQAYSVLSDRKRRALFDRFGEASLALGFDPARAAGRPDRNSQPASAKPRSSTERAPRQARPPPKPRPRQEQPPGPDLHRHLPVELLTALRGGEVKVASPSGALLTVEVPAGVETGQRIRLKGRGRPGQGGGLPGDLYLEVEVLPHPFFRRDGRHLVLELPLTIEEAWRGADIEIPSLEGWLRLRVPAGSRGGELLRLRGKGPRTADGSRGDLHVHLCIRLPDRLEAAARALERLGTLYSSDVRAGLRF